MSEDQRSTLVALLVVGLAAAPSLAAADPLADAEAAYGRVEFGETLRFAQAALSGGGYEKAQLVRIYFLLGVSAAAEGKDEEAIGAFKHLLSLDPATKLDSGLSPRLQGPMMEARGSQPPPLACDAVFDRGKGALHLSLRDPLAMSATAVVRSRLSAGAAFYETRARAGATIDIPIPGSAGAEHVEYYFQLLDAHKNRLLEKGSDAAPEVFQVAVAPVQTSSQRVLPTRWLVLGIVGEVIGAAGLAGGIGAYVVGNNAADRWNNDSICLANGMSRATNCSSDRNTAQAASSGAIASFTIGGVFIAASTILLIAAPRTPREQNVASLRCGGGPGIVGVACGGAF